MLVLVGFCYFGGIVETPATSADSGYTLEKSFPNLSFEKPVDLQYVSDGTHRLFVVEQGGKIQVFNNQADTANKSVYLDIADRVVSGGEKGLLGLTFSPNFPVDHYFFVDYTNSTHTRISRFTEINGVGDPSSEYLILEVQQPYSNHNAGQIAFGPDRMLYVTLGDGGSGGDPHGNGQNLSTLLGSLLRLDVLGTPDPNLHYAIPIDNPFVNHAGSRGEIFAYGLRNPWRFSFDNVTGSIWLADVGQNNWEEIDIISPGGNYGWNTMEGTHCYSPSSGCNETGLELPVFEYSHDYGNAVTGGYVYRGKDFPTLYGKYIFGDYASGRVWMTDVTTNQTTQILDTDFAIPSFGVDEFGEIYIVSFNDGLFHIIPNIITSTMTITTVSGNITITTQIETIITGNSISTKSKTIYPVLVALMGLIMLSRFSKVIRRKHA